MAPAPGPTPPAPAPPAPPPAWPAWLTAGSAAAVALALAFYNGFLEPFSLAAMTLAGAAAVAAALGARRSGVSTPPGLERLLGAALAVSLALDLALPPGYDPDWPRLGAWRPLVAVAAVIAASYAWRGAPRLLVRARFPALLLLALALGGVVIRAVPDPAIDVYTFQRLAAGAVLHGHNPYTLHYPSAYADPLRFLSREVLSPDLRSIVWYPYLPVAALAGAPFLALGADVRWAVALAMVVTAWALRRLGRGARAAELAAVLLLFQPRGFFVVRQAWSDPLILAALALTLLAASRWLARDAAGAGGRRAWVATGVLAGVACATKQYAPLFLGPLLLAVPARGRWRAAALAVAVAGALVAPFALAAPRAFYDGVVRFQGVAPFREDALSWLAALVRLGGPRLPWWPGFALAAAVLAVTVPLRPTPAQATLAGGAAFLALVLLSPQAFCNYYWLAAGVLLAAVALAAGEDAAAPRYREPPAPAERPSPGGC